MAGAEKIINRIHEEVRAQARIVIKNAEDEADRIIKDAKEKAAVKENEILNNAKEEAEELKKRLIAISELEARKKILNAKQEAIEEVFSRALLKLQELPDDKYEDIIIDMVVNSVRSGDETIIISKRDKMRLSSDFISKINERLAGKGIKGNIRFSDQTKEMSGGFILKSGNIELNNSFDAIVKMRRDDIEAQVVKIMF